MNQATESSRPPAGAEIETICLTDGERFLLRPVRPSDKAAFVRAFDRLSSESRYRRFLGHKRELSESDLRFFTEVDGDRHGAVVAVAPSCPGEEEEVVGVARFVRLDDPPETAEIAVTVVDTHHRRGIGTCLLERLLEAAFERGVRKIRVQLLAENLPIRKLLDKILGAHELDREGAVFSGEIPLELPLPRKAQQQREPLFELLRLAAEEAVLPINLALIRSRAELSALKGKLSSQGSGAKSDTEGAGPSD